MPAYYGSITSIIIAGATSFKQAIPRVSHTYKGCHSEVVLSGKLTLLYFSALEGINA